MQSNGKALRFTADDRDAIRKQTVGTPTDVAFEVGPIAIRLIPLTVEQAEDIFGLLDAFTEVQKQANDSGDVAAAGEVWAALISREGRRAKKLMREILLESAEANGLVDDVEVFDLWLGRLPLVDTIKALLPKVVEAQGLMTMMGKSSTPTSQPSETPGN
jgi:hypothetical protein